MSSLTLVTGFININRDQWTENSRAQDEYLDHLRNVCQLRNHLVLWVDPKLADIVRTFRSSIPNTWRTTINTFTIADCRLWPSLARIEEIMQKYKTKPWEHVKASSSPEYTKPLYDIVMHQKMDWLARSKQQCEIAGHGTDYYAWIDAGYTHGKVNLTGSITVKPECEGKIYITKIWPWAHLPWFYDMEEFIFHWPIVVVDGGFYCMDARLVGPFNTLYYSLMDKCLKQGIIDDDQFTLTMLMMDYPDLFHPVIGDWCESGKLLLETCK